MYNNVLFLMIRDIIGNILISSSHCISDIPCSGKYNSVTIII